MSELSRDDWRRALDEYEAEVDREAISLLKQGYDPHEARRIASETIQQKRRSLSRAQHS